MSKSINLIYSSRNPSYDNFFAKIEKMRGIILKFKSDEIINHFDEKDEFEVGRGASYAVFPELKKLCDDGKKITLDALRESLRSRGIEDVFFQNKIMSLLLQGKSGVQYALGGVLNSIFLENGHNFLMNPNYNVSLNVKNNGHVKLIFTAKWHDFSDSSNDCFEGKAEVDITPEKITLSSFKVTQLRDDIPEANNAFAFLKSNQVSLWQKIVIFLKTFFDANTSLRVEDETVDKKLWRENVKNYEEKPGKIEVEDVEEEDQEDESPSFTSLP